MGMHKRESAFALTFGVGTVDWFEPLRGMQRWRGVARIARWSNSRNEEEHGIHATEYQSRQRV